MEYYLKGYYGYKNLGDELLLFGVLGWLKDNADATKIMVESGDPIRLSQWIRRHHYLLPLGVEIYCVGKNSARMYNNMHLILGGGEVLSDARNFPYNGRNYLLKHFWRIIKGKFSLLGGIGKPKSFITKWLYAFILPKAKHIVTRDKASFAVAYEYHDRPILNTDFSYIPLQKIAVEKQESVPYNIINLNPYKRDTKSKRKVEEILDTRTGDWIFIAGDIGEDIPIFRELQQNMVDITLFDWTAHSLHEIASFLASAQYGLATRLHILLLLKYFQIPNTPLVYQEKITHVLGFLDEDIQDQEVHQS